MFGIDLGITVVRHGGHDRPRFLISSLVTGAGVFGVATAFADVQLELDAEVLGFRIGGGFGLDDDLIAFAFGELGGGDEFAVFDLEGDLGFTSGSFGGGGDDFGGGGLGFHGGVIDGDADAAVFLDEELGLLATEVEDEAFAGTGFDFGIRKGGRGGEGDEGDEVEQCFHGVFVWVLGFP